MVTANGVLASVDDAVITADSLLSEALRITRKKIAAAASWDLGYGEHGRRMRPRITNAYWGVYVNGKKVGTYHDRKYQHEFAAPDGKRYSAFGNWKRIQAKLADPTQRTEFPLP